MTALNPMNCDWQVVDVCYFLKLIYQWITPAGRWVHCIYRWNFQCSNDPPKVFLSHKSLNLACFLSMTRGEYYVNETGFVIVCLNGFLGTLADRFQRFKRLLQLFNLYEATSVLRIDQLSPFQGWSDHQLHIEPALHPFLGCHPLHLHPLQGDDTAYDDKKQLCLDPQI